MEEKEKPTIENGTDVSEKAEAEKTENRRVGNIQVDKKKGPNIALIIIAIIFSLIAITMVTFGLVNKLNDKVYSNIFINGVDLSGKTEQEVGDIVNDMAKDFKNNVTTVKHNGEIVIELTPDSIDMSIDTQATIKSIMDYGRDENIVLNNVKILKAMFEKVELVPTYKHSEAKLTNLSSEITSGIDGRVKDDSFSVDEEEYVLVITRGKAGKDIVVEEFKAEIIQALKENVSGEYTLKLEERQPNSLDVDVVYAKVCREPKDAYVDETVKPVVYNKHVMGISFDKEELRQTLAMSENQGEGKVITFKLTATAPKVKIQDITKDIYNDKLGSYTSSYANSDKNRASNVVLGAKMLNGTIVMPGETFSFNKVMGDCGLSSRGFKSAAVFKGGKVVQEIGGGICQISSTLYIAVLYANLDIVSRANHALPVGYVPVSLDATVYYPYTDFKFKNTRDYPVKIVATTTSSRKLTITIQGTKEDKEYEVVLNSWVTGTIAPKVEQQNDSKLEVGKTKVIQEGTNGYKSVAYKTVKYNGKVVSKVLLSEDSYGSMPKIIAVGTKAVVQESEKQEPSGGVDNNNTGTTTPEQPDSTPTGNTGSTTPPETNENVNGGTSNNDSNGSGSQSGESNNTQDATGSQS